MLTHRLRKECSTTAIAVTLCWAIGIAVIELTPTAYQESAACDAPVLTATGIGWNAAGMHHIDPPHVSTFIRDCVEHGRTLP
jgi:hypothetical protein